MLTNYALIEKGTDKAEATVKRMFGFLRHGTYLVTFQHIDPKADAKAYRGLYFVKVQTIAEETGHSKKEMHEIVKQNFLQQVVGKDSTKDLSLEEWLGVIKALDLWAYQTYEVILD
jgi:hypothetical protein